MTEIRVIQSSVNFIKNYKLNIKLKGIQWVDRNQIDLRALGAGGVGRGGASPLKLLKECIFILHAHPGRVLVVPPSVHFPASFFRRHRKLYSADDGRWLWTFDDSRRLIGGNFASQWRVVRPRHFHFENQRWVCLKWYKTINCTKISADPGEFLETVVLFPAEIQLDIPSSPNVCTEMNFYRVDL